MWQTTSIIQGNQFKCYWVNVSSVRSTTSKYIPEPVLNCYTAGCQAFAKPS